MAIHLRDDGSAATDGTQTPPDFLQPPVVQDFFLPPSSPPDPGEAYSTQSTGAWNGFSLIKGEDLVLKRGVPVLDSNPTARPWGKSRPPSRTPAANAIASGSAPGAGSAGADDGDFGGGTVPDGTDMTLNDADLTASQQGSGEDKAAASGTGATSATGGAVGSASGAGGNVQSTPVATGSPGQEGAATNKQINNQGDPDDGKTKQDIIKKIGGAVTTADDRQAELYNVNKNDVIAYDDGHGMVVRRLTPEDMDNPENKPWLRNNRDAGVGSWAVFRDGKLSDESAPLPREMGFYAVCGELTLPARDPGPLDQKPSPPQPAAPTAQPLPPKNEQPGASRTQQQPEAVKPEKKLYQKDADGMISFGNENPVAALDQAMADGAVDSAQGAALRKQLLEHPGQALDEGRMEALSHMSGAQLRAQVGAGQLSRDDMHAVVKRQSEMAQAAADKRDNGVGVARDFTTRLLAKDSELVNRGLQHMAHWVGDEESEEQYRQTADVMGDMGSGKFGDTNPGKDSLQAVGQWMEKPLVEIPTPGADFMKAHPYLGGMAAGAAKFASGFTTPENILMMVATEGMGPIARKLVGMGFTVMNAKQIVEQSKQLLEEKDPEKRAEGIMQLTLQLGTFFPWGRGGKNKATAGKGEGEGPQSGGTGEPPSGEAGGESQSQTGEPRLSAKESGAEPPNTGKPKPMATPAPIKIGGSGPPTQPKMPDFLKKPKAKGLSEKPPEEEQSPSHTGPIKAHEYIDKAKSELAERIAKAGLKIDTSGTHGEVAVYNAKQKAIFLNPKKVAGLIGYVERVRHGDGYQFVKALLNEEFTHHELDEETGLGGPKLQQYYRNVYNNLSNAQKSILSKFYGDIDALEVDGNTIEIPEDIKQSRYGAEWLRIERMLARGETMPQEFFVDENIMNNLKQEMDSWRLHNHP